MWLSALISVAFQCLCVGWWRQLSYVKCIRNDRWHPIEEMIDAMYATCSVYHFFLTQFWTAFFCCLPKRFVSLTNKTSSTMNHSLSGLKTISNKKKASQETWKIEIPFMLIPLIRCLQYFFSRNHIFLIINRLKFHNERVYEEEKKEAKYLSPLDVNKRNKFQSLLEIAADS